MKRESSIEQRHRMVARDHGWFVAKIMRASPNGFPDRFYAKEGRVVLVEWKRPGGVTSVQQRLRFNQLKAAGVEVYIIDNLDDANRILGISESL